MLLLAKTHIIILYPREHLEIALLLVITFLRSCGIVKPPGIPEPSEVLFFFLQEGGGVLLYCLIIDGKPYNKITELRNSIPFHKSRFLPPQYKMEVL